MNRQIFISTIIGFVIGMTVMSHLKNSQQAKEINLFTDVVKVASDATKQYAEGYYKLIDQNAELLAQAKLYGEAKSENEKVKIADELVLKIKKFSSPSTK